MDSTPSLVEETKKDFADEGLNEPAEPVKSQEHPLEEEVESMGRPEAQVDQAESPEQNLERSLEDLSLESGAPEKSPGKAEKTEESKLDEDADCFKPNWSEKVDSFDDYGLKEQVLMGVYGFGFQKPSPIQQTSILPIIKGHDTIAQAQSGTGKTGAFTIAALQCIDDASTRIQALILSPTRELTLQTAFVVSEIGKRTETKVIALVGGTSVREDISSLKRGAHIVVGCPGRVLDMMKKGFFSTEFMRILILDEADEMLSRGFDTQIKDIFKYLPGDVQVALFSATLPHEILRITKSFMREPKKILVKSEDLTLEGISQFYVAVEKEDWKLEVLLDLYSNIDITKALIYCNTKKRVFEVAQFLTENDFSVSAMHGELTQREREDLMKEFRSGATRVLITTDLLARGIDVQSVSLVINYELPRQPENYIHRIGRAGRFGRKGVAINFVIPNDSMFMKQLQQHYNTQIQQLPSNLEEIDFQAG